MHVRPSSEQEERVLNNCRLAGVVLDYVLLQPDADEINGGGAAHQRAAAIGVAEAARRRKTSDVVHEDHMTGRRIGRSEFYGWHFDLGQRRLKVPASGQLLRAWHENRGYSAPPPTDGAGRIGYGPYAWADEEDPSRLFLVYEPFDSGYAGAFVSPPYWLNVGLKRTQELFLDVDRIVLDVPTDATEIWLWPGGGWASYFDDGLDWWGAWAATIRTRTNRFVVVCASATD